MLYKLCHENSRDTLSHLRHLGKIQQQREEEKEIQGLTTFTTIRASSSIESRLEAIGSS